MAYRGHLFPRLQNHDYRAVPGGAQATPAKDYQLTALQFAPFPLPAPLFRLPWTKPYREWQRLFVQPFVHPPFWLNLQWILAQPGGGLDDSFRWEAVILEPAGPNPVVTKRWVHAGQSDAAGGHLEQADLVYNLDPLWVPFQFFSWAAVPW